MADRIKAVFLEALDTPTDQRPAYLDRACGGDTEVRRRVEVLLRAHEATNRVLDRPVWRPAPAPAGGPAERAGRAHLLGEIARGGMGAVLRGHDPELGRELAVKVILPAHRDNPDLVRRFVSEARLAGQLQHPGIVPVYDVGQMDDGRPFFTMKLVEGRTLAELLAERPGPGHDLPRFLRYFEAVCQAVGYAHARGVVHRDLKPPNVMVGAFGEVQVMDWGLAKRLEEVGAEGALEQPPSLPAPSSSATLPAALTRPGEVVGTPSYLAPERARGAAGDQRADVFGLGAILCEILTGGPPFRRAGLLGLLEQAREGDLKDATERLDCCGADPELVRLAKDCLVAGPAGRPPDGSAVAARVAEHLAGAQERLRRAEVGQARAEARAEGERSRRRLAVGLAAALFAVVVLGGGTLLLVQRHQAEQARRQQAAESALARAADLQRQGRWAEALAVLEQARQRLDERDGQVSRDILRALAEVELVGRLEKARLRATTGTGGAWAMARADREFEAEFRAAGLGGPDEPAEAVAERVRASGVRAALVAAFDAWALAIEDPRRRAWAEAVARSADQGGDWARRLRASWEAPAALEALAREAPLDRLSPHLLTTLAGALVSSRRDAVPFLRKAQWRYPGDFWLTFFLAQRLDQAGQHAEAAGFYRAALAARPDTPAVLVNLGIALQAQKKLDEACDCFRQAIALDPTEAMYHTNLGLVLAGKGHVDEAIACYRKALALDPKDFKAHTGLGNALRNKGKADQAIACYRKAIELRPQYARAHNNLGAILCDIRRDYDGAIACFQKAIALDPKDAGAHTNLGIALRNKGKARRDEATACYRKAIACFQTAIALDPKDARPHYNLGGILSEVMRDHDGAVVCFRRAVELDPNFPEAHCNLGHALKGRGDFAEALGPFRCGHELGSKRGGWKYPSAEWARDCERLIEQEKKLLDVLGGKLKPADARERIEWARLCMWTRRYAAAVRLWGEVFGAEGKLANDLEAGHRYRAATAAALAGAGHGRDASELTNEARDALRKQALDWLKADLAAWRSHGAGDQRGQALRNWRADRALAVVRDEKELAKLPRPERAAWEGLWAEVGELLKLGR
jgi:serine/threonine-protein kinase